MVSAVLFKTLYYFNAIKIYVAIHAVLSVAPT